jgi:hypothetical protein
MKASAALVNAHEMLKTAVASPLDRALFMQNIENFHKTVQTNC